MSEQGTASGGHRAENFTESVSEVCAVCSTHEQGLFEMLLRELDGYAMAIQALLLLENKHFKLLNNGELDIDAPTKTCCEDRRLAIRSLAGRLLHPLANRKKTKRSASWRPRRMKKGR